MGTEDQYGLYEVIWWLNSRCPEASPEQKLDAARRAMANLLDGGLVVLSFGSLSACDALSGPQSLEVIADSATWAVPDASGRLYSFSATPLGEREYFGRAGSA